MSGSKLMPTTWLPPARRGIRLTLAAAAVLAFMALSGNAPALAPDVLAARFAALEKVDAVVEGSASPKRVLYVFFDANCWYCHLAWKALQPYERAGLQVRWVPVAYQKDSSVTRAAAIMLAKDRVAALRENETGYEADSYDGGIDPADEVPPELEARFKANTDLMQNFDSPGTPTLVWRDAAGKIRVKIGMPRLRQLPDITGLPLQHNNDPALKDLY
jgi:thiol:disulfide interchange protein DsbG